MRNWHEDVETRPDSPFAFRLEREKRKPRGVAHYRTVPEKNRMQAGTDSARIRFAIMTDAVDLSHTGHRHRRRRRRKRAMRRRRRPLLRRLAKHLSSSDPSLAAETETTEYDVTGGADSDPSLRKSSSGAAAATAHVGDDDGVRRRRFENLKPPTIELVGDLSHVYKTV